MIGIGLPVLVLDAAVGLINTCDVKQLMGIPRNLSTTFFSYLKELWIQVRDKNLLKNATHCSQGIDHTISNLRIHDLAESIFRFSIYLCQYTINCTTMVIERSMFGPNQSDLEHFMFNHWENSSFLLKDISKPIEDDSYIFSALFQSFIFKRTIDAVLSSILVGLVSCPPLPSDELDMLNFLKEVKDELGSPMCYGQDIRIVKTEELISGVSQGNLKREVHFSNEYADSSYPSGSDSLYNGSVRRCKEALQEGYTIALRGMEFRTEIIAAVADRLAVMFGMPSVGVNAYLTPPKSQGLARHYDDHCVFVCQLLGRKQWKTFTRPTLRLPRLYEPCDSLLGCGSDNDASRFEQFLLDEGDILYIPRGCPHEACTTADDNELEMDDELTGFSLHLTFGIEVEPPFEWEGFAHVSVCHWSQNQIQHSATPTPDGSMCSLINAMSINLLHVGIQLIGSYDPVFRKACMIAGISLPSLDCNKRTTFRYVIDKIDKGADFTEAFKCVAGAIQAKNDDLFQRMRWLRHIYEEKDSQYVINWNNPLMGFEKLWLLCDGHREDLEAAFMQTKTRFCKDVVFENACESMRVLLQKYMIVRKQYMSGMLSLHCT